MFPVAGGKQRELQVFAGQSTSLLDLQGVAAGVMMSRPAAILMLSPNVPFELRTDRLDASWQTPQLSTDDLELHAAVGEHLP
ncbi:hypothetical protein GCM10009831_09770 [Dietzia cercidiphylli]|uniref:Uncharacterized protein n=1 Tax=Dietzia cercidiphylli TaxID=498199 RepID=A0ABN2ID92_9ACTN